MPNAKTATERFIDALAGDADLMLLLTEAVAEYRADGSTEVPAEVMADIIDDTYQNYLPETHYMVARIVADSIDAAELLAWLDANLEGE